MTGVQTCALPIYTLTSNVPFWGKFFFQLVFCGTAATIVSGAVAERIKYVSFIIFSFVLTLVIYPIVGHWIWGGGWLSTVSYTHLDVYKRQGLDGLPVGGESA